MSELPSMNPPKGVPLAPGAYMDAKGGIWLVEETRFGKLWRVPGGLLLHAANAMWETVLKNTGALPFRRMAPLRKKD